MHISLNDDGMDVLQLSVILTSKEDLYLAASFYYSYSVRQVFRDPKFFSEFCEARFNLWVNDKSSSLKKYLVTSVLSDGNRHWVLLANRNKPSPRLWLKGGFGKPSCLLSTSLDLFWQEGRWWCVCCPINCSCQHNMNREYNPNKSWNKMFHGDGERQEQKESVPGWVQ